MPQTTTATNEDENGFRLKTIATLGNSRTVRILTQNENGPCPLLALANVLLLRSDISIGESKKRISFEALVELLGDYLIRHTSEASNDNLMDAINLIPTLQNGLDVNVTFDSVFGFETTPSLALFAAFGVPLCHGWVYEGGDGDALLDLKSGPTGSSCEQAAPPAWSGIAGYKELMSYNQLVEAVVNGQVAAIELGHAPETNSNAQVQVEAFADVASTESQSLEMNTKTAIIASLETSAETNVTVTGDESLETRVVDPSPENVHGVGDEPLLQTVSDSSAVSNLSETLAELTVNPSSLLSDATSAPIVTEPGVECVDTHEEMITSPPDSAATTEAVPIEPVPIDFDAGEPVAHEMVAISQPVTTEPVANDAVITESVSAEPVAIECVAIDSVASAPLPSESVIGSVPAETVAPKLAQENIADDIILIEAVQPTTVNGANELSDTSAGTEPPAEIPIQLVETLGTSEMPAQVQADNSNETRIADDAAKELVRAAEKREGKKVVSSIEVSKNTVDMDPAKKAELEKQVVLGQAADLFLSTTSTQLTSAGLNQLAEKIEPANLSVLFRNNHFSTLFNHPQLGLFTLVTDEGFLTKKCVWETLCLDGDGVFVDGEFGAYSATASDEGLDGSSGGAVDIAGVDIAEQERAWKAIVEGGGGDGAGVRGGGGVDNDLAFAMSLQEEENRRAQPAGATPPTAHSRKPTAGPTQQQLWMQADMKEHLQGLRAKAPKKDASKTENECAIQ
ncbi:hypothetical protein HDU77_006295 [Chytriomyces hyalinus]|nr:hypothetical protein HDU77_006295 [Chytriomyces hyalinus]